MLWFRFALLACLFETKHSIVPRLSDVILNMLKAWVYFKGHLRQTELTLADYQLAKFWADLQVTINEVPLALTSIALKKLFELGLVRVMDLWNATEVVWRA